MNTEMNPRAPFNVEMYLAVQEGLCSMVSASPCIF